MDANIPSQPDIPPSDETLGHYALRRRLGEGGFGEVFEAWDTRLCRSVAVKRLKLLSEGFRPEQLLTEARLAASLNHEAFVDIFAIDDHDDSQFIIMEMVPGSTLQAFIREQRPDEKRALEIIEQIAAAMAQAHESKLVHGDLKPSNLMVEPSGRIRILDFGLARQIDPLATGSGTLTGAGQEGTIAYMAPERLLGSAPDTGSDIYALGVILYELIAGERPFAGLHGLALAAAHMQSRPEQWPLPASVSPACASLIQQMTAREPAMRPRSMQAVREAAAATRAGRKLPQLGAGRVLDGTLVPRFGRKQLALTVLAAGLLLGGIAAYRSMDWQQAFTPRPSEASLMNRGMAALHNFDRDNELQVAIDQFNTILQYNARHAAAAAGLALAYSLRYTSDGRDEVWLQRADASARLALQLDDQLALAHAAMAWVQDQQGKVRESEASTERALSLDPSNIYGLNGKAQWLIHQERLDEAATIVQQAMAYHPRERLFVDLLGTIRYQQGDYVAAETAFRNSIALQPDATYAYANLNAALLRQNRLDEALQVLQQGLQIRPNGKLYSNLGTALYARGDYLGAASAFERAASGAKGSPNDYLKWANLGDALRWVPGRKDDADKAYNRAIQLLDPLLARTPDNVTLRTRGALYHARVGDKARAKAWLQQGLATAPNNPDAHFRAGLAYELLGEREQAVAETISAIELGYPVSLIESEPDLVNLRRETRYQQHLIGKKS